MNAVNADLVADVTWASQAESASRGGLVDSLKNTTIPNDQLLANLGLFLDAKNLSRILFMDFLYRQILDVQGVVFDFGTRWGQNAALFTSFRGIYEPFNRHRRIVGFDTFTGFPGVAAEDGSSPLMEPGKLATTAGYQRELETILSHHEQLNPLSHIRKTMLCQGDACETVEKYIVENPQTIVSLAYFDFDIYAPTKRCLELIRPRLVKGSVLGFDELNDPDSPGETLALMEVFGLNAVRLKRFPHASRVSYFVVE
ncbi:MAG: crotonobetainyl-CoA--carnitine CoA-transferase [Alphaproteobacteria bacterium]